MLNEFMATQPEGPLLLDGGMGQELLRRGMQRTNHALWSANALLDEPALVQSVHEDYLRAGADIITTNTYSTSRERLEGADLGDRMAEINRQAGTLAERAQEMVGREALIAGSLPPFRGSYRPDRVGDFEEIEPKYREQAEILAPHVDLFLCETMSTADEARAAASGAASTGKPVLVSWTVEEDVPEDADSVPLRSGESLEEALTAVSDLPVDGFLLNCSPPESLTAAMPLLSRLTDHPVGGYANGFADIPEGWRETVDESPEARRDLSPSTYAKYAEQWLNDGAQIVGGCCEVGPEHIEHLRKVMDATLQGRRDGG